MKTGWIGLGNLGRAMALRLKECDTDLLLWNRSPTKAEGMGLLLAESPADAVERSNLIWLNLYDSVAVRQVLEGDRGILSRDLTDKIIIDTTTNHFRDVLEFHSLVK